jgi:TolA-binding protein
MSSFSRVTALSAMLAGAAMIAAPLVQVHAQAASSQAPSSMSAPAAGMAGKDSASMKAESVEDRIQTLHTELKITPDEENDWNKVAQTMRDNASRMEKLAAETQSQNTEAMTAVDDLKTYEKFARAHIEGLKNLTSSFETLYKAMPEAQKKVADQVFNTARQDREASHS